MSASRSAEPIAGVVARMERIASGLPASDGVARFNDLYLAVTRAVLEETAGGEFEDPVFLSRLDVVFAGLYFDAFDDDAAGRAIGSAWKPLFRARTRRGIAPIQFALAGMNAHINHDLSLALVATMAELGLSPKRGTPQFRDFVRVNALLERVEGEVKARLLDEMLSVADEALGRVDDVLAMWSVARARDAAWTHAQALWELRDEPQLHEAFLDSLASFVGLASRGLLIRTL
jgi:Family of unknown function (DUF5995)